MPQNSNYEFGAIPDNLLSYVKDKSKSSKAFFSYFLARTKKMFQYTGLPDTIEADILERYLQMNGIACITDYKGKLYCFNGNSSGEQDVYYRPSLFIVANPHFEETFNKTVIVAPELTNYNRIPDDSQSGVRVRNDSEWIGLTPLIARYSVMMAENLLTIRSADVMLRIIALLSSGTDAGVKSAIAYLKKLENGDFGVIADSSFAENGLKMQSPPSNNGSYLTQFIELHQYLLGSFYNELGLRANYNMKREAIGEGESSMDEDAILPLCDDMLTCRRQDMQRVNDLYGTNISVDYSSAWLENAISRKLTLLSQLKESGAGKVRNDEGDVLGGDGDLGNVVSENGQVDSELTQDGESEDQVGSTEVESDATGKDNKDGWDGNGDTLSSGNNENEGRQDSESGENDSKAEEGDRNKSGDNETSEGSDTGSGRDSGETGVEGIDTSNINDITPDDLAVRVEQHLEDVEIEKPDDMSQLMEGDENGFLGREESSGNQDSDTGN